MLKTGDIVNTRYKNGCRILYIVEKKYNPYQDDILIIDSNLMIQSVHDDYIRQFHIPINLKGRGIVMSSNVNFVKSGFNPKELLLNKILYVDKK